MAFTFAAFCYMLTLVLCAALIFFVIWQVSLTPNSPLHLSTVSQPSGNVTVVQSESEVISL